jgi:hypothetical protein
MVSHIPLLQNVRVAAPCSESWDDMQSVDGDRVHHCLGCKMNVYNLSAMTQSEAEGLLRKHEGRLCVRYYQRRDGTVMTRNCPVGAHAARLLLIRGSLAAAALFAISGVLLYAAQPKPLMGDVGGREMMGSAVPQEPPIMGKRILTSLEPPAKVVKPMMGQVSLSRQQMDQLMQKKDAPRIDVTMNVTVPSKDVPITPFEEKSPQP